MPERNKQKKRKVVRLDALFLDSDEEELLDDIYSNRIANLTEEQVDDMSMVELFELSSSIVSKMNYDGAMEITQPQLPENGIINKETLPLQPLRDDDRVEFYDTSENEHPDYNIVEHLDQLSDDEVQDSSDEQPMYASPSYPIVEKLKKVDQPSPMVSSDQIIEEEEVENVIEVDEIRTKRVIIVDENGDEKATLLSVAGAGTLELLNGDERLNGPASVELSAYQNRCGLSIVDADTASNIYVMVSNTGAQVDIGGPRDESSPTIPRVSVECSKIFAGIRIKDKHEKERIGLGLCDIDPTLDLPCSYPLDYPHLHLTGHHTNQQHDLQMSVINQHPSLTFNHPHHVYTIPPPTPSKPNYLIFSPPDGSLPSISLLDHNHLHHPIPLEITLPLLIQKGLDLTVDDI